MLTFDFLFVDFQLECIPAVDLYGFLSELRPRNSGGTTAVKQYKLAGYTKASLYFYGANYTAAPALHGVKFHPALPFSNGYKNPGLPNHCFNSGIWFHSRKNTNKQFNPAGWKQQNINAIGNKLNVQKGLIKLNDPDLMGSHEWFNRVGDSLETKNLQGLQNLLTRFRPRSVAFHAKRLIEWAGLKTDNEEFTKSRLEFYSLWASDLEKQMFMVIHEMKRYWWDFKRKIPNVTMTPQEIWDNGLYKRCQHYSGQMLVKYGDFNGTKYVFLTL